jgi:hypothetical protein
VWVIRNSVHCQPVLHPASVHDSYADVSCRIIFSFHSFFLSLCPFLFFLSTLAAFRSKACSNGTVYLQSKCCVCVNYFVPGMLNFTVCKAEIFQKPKTGIGLLGPISHYCYLRPISIASCMSWYLRFTSN